ncbi:MAG: hypothetical protein ABI047_03315, partial [Jatrophihabitantaceae bacterium]
SSFMHEILDNPVVSDGGSFVGPSVTLEALGLEPTDVPRPSDIAAPAWCGPMWDRVTEYLRALDEVPLHFHLHLMHAAEIVGYKHPDGAIRGWWLGVYHRLVADLHLTAETEEELDARLSDSRAGWLARGDVATND